MKKFIFGAAALLTIAGFTSCGKCGDGACSTNDSVSAAYGNYVGSMLNADFTQFSHNNDNADKQEFLRGVQLAFGADNNNNTRMGMQVGVQILNELNGLKNQGVELDQAAVMKAFKAAFLNDSINQLQITEATNTFSRLYEKAQAEAQAEAEKSKAEEPEAIQNGVVANQAVADLKASNPEAKTTDSGLAYVIETPGTDPKPEANATVVVHYTGKHLNGEVFDSSVQRGEPATFNLQAVVPGFREGLMLLGKGGKATLYIPGELGYGVNGQPQAGIAPNEMLVFDVELIDINPAN